MGQKTHPYSFRLGSYYTWKSRWFASGKEYRQYLLEDIKIRRLLTRQLKGAGLTKVEIERTIDHVNIQIHVARPGVVIGRGGSNLEALQKSLMGLLDISEPEKLKLEVFEVEKPTLSARVMAESISDQLVKRLRHRRVVAKAMDRAMEGGAKGVKVQLSGRIAGAEIGRTEKYSRGTVPLQTLRSRIDYAQTPALTKSGYIGVKVWIHK
jgi:small subunit ribosomal protein S3